MHRQICRTNYKVEEDVKINKSTLRFEDSDKHSDTLAIPNSIPLGSYTFPTWIAFISIHFYRFGLGHPVHPDTCLSFVFTSMCGSPPVLPF